MTTLTADNAMRSDTLAQSHAVCGAKTKSGGTCKSKPVTGRNRCRMHGGTNNGAPIKHGLYSKRLQQQPQLRERIEEIKSDTRLMDGREHLAAALALLENSMDSLSPSDLHDMEVVRVVSTIVSQVQKSIESIHKIEQGHWLPPEQVQAEIQRAGQVIQSECKGCDRLPSLAAKFHKLSS